VERDSFGPIPQAAAVNGNYTPGFGAAKKGGIVAFSKMARQLLVLNLRIIVLPGGYTDAIA
jgi:hypothetical protein